MIISIPDELFEKFMDRGAMKTLEEVQKSIIQTLQKCVNEGMDMSSVVLSNENVQLLREMLGPFVSAPDMVSRVRRIGTIRVQGKEYLLTQEQINRIKGEAFAHHRNGEPRSEAEAKPEDAQRIVARYVGQQIDYFIKQMCSQI